MLRIECPWCGVRDETEFRYRGDASLPHPESNASLAECCAQTYVRENRRGWHLRWWRACRRPPEAPSVVRHTDTHEIRAVGQCRISGVANGTGAAVSGRAELPRVCGRARTSPSNFVSTGERCAACAVTLWPPPCSPMACSSSGAASSITGRAASSRRGPRSPAPWSRSSGPADANNCPATTLPLQEGLIAEARTAGLHCARCPLLWQSYRALPACRLLLHLRSVRHRCRGRGARTTRPTTRAVTPSLPPCH